VCGIDAILAKFDWGAELSVCSVSGTLSNREGCTVFLGAGVVGWFPNTLSVRFLNSNSSKMGLSFSLFTGSRRSDFSSKVKGTSVLMVAKNLENSICERFSSTLVFKAPFNRSVFASRFSIPPKSAISLTAVFSPTPGQPGMLSELSPINPNMSITCSGDCMPYFVFISSGPKISKSPPNLGRYMKMCDDTNCP